MANLDDLFEACLVKIEVGGTIEECLESYPDQADQLEALLQVASALRALGDSPPARDPAAVAAGRQRFLAQAAALRASSSDSVEEAFEASLQMLAAGASVEDCIDAFPQAGAELHELL